MYQKFFGFTEKPFDVTPDPRFLFLSSHHQEALSSIIYGIRERRGFITLVGEVGTGKTTLLNATFESLDEKIRTAFIFNTDIDFDALLQMVLIELDLASSDEAVPKYVALDRLNRYATEQFAAGGNVALFIDEAQNLDIRTMENLRLLSNLETQRHKLIQIVLSGQPELDGKLKQKELRQLAQRINMRRYITPLDESDTYGYIQQHLEKAGHKGNQLFDRASLKQIWNFSQGVPRKINLLCDNTLLIAYGLDKKKISRSIVDEAIRDLSWSPYDHQVSPEMEVKSEVKESYSWPFQIRWPAIAGILLLSVLLGVGAYGFLHLNKSGITDIPRKTGAVIMEFLGNFQSEQSVIEDGREVVENRSGVQAVDRKTGEPEQMPNKSMAHAQVYSIESDLAESSEISGSRNDTARDEPIRVSEKRMDLDLPIENPASGAGDGEEKKQTSRSTKKDIGIKRPRHDMGEMKDEMVGTRNVVFLPEHRRQSPPRATASVNSGFGARDYSTSSQRVIVEKGDYLALIVKQYYGRSTPEIMALVINENPSIRDPNLIVPGQVIKMPEIESRLDPHGMNQAQE